MTTAEKEFKQIQKLPANPKLKEQYAVVHRNIQENKKQHKELFTDLTVLRKRAEAIKNKALENLDNYLITFESNFIKNGGTIHWALDAEEANEIATQLFQKQNAKTYIKSKSKIISEIGLVEHLKQQGITGIESDLGDEIVRQANEKSYHPLLPAIGLTMEEVGAKTKLGSTPETIIRSHTQALKSELRDNQVFISGANFLLADCGGLATLDNEGNIGSGKALASTHIVIAGIDKVVPSINDIELFSSLAAYYGTGGIQTAYTNITIAPEDGKQLHLILVDNNRAELLADEFIRTSLSCLGCGACTTACPVVTTLGADKAPYLSQGAIGMLTYPYLNDRKEYGFLAHASTMCGACSSECPVNIDIPGLLQRSRIKQVSEGDVSKAEKLMWFLWKGAMLKRSKMDKGGSVIKNFAMKQFLKKKWGEDREMPEIASKSFNQIMRERMNIK